MTETTLPLPPETLIPRLGEHLINHGLITTEQLEAALQYQSVLRKTWPVAPLLGEILVELGYLSRAKLDSSITEYVIQLRNALVESNQQLERRVQERTAELEKAMVKLSELNQLKANFIANISHELRTPLTHIKGYQEMMLSGEMGPLTEEQTAALQAIQRSTTRLERLIEDLILFASAERTQLPIKPEVMELTSLCRDVIEQNQVRIADQQLLLELIAPDTDVKVSADREKLGWVLYQLVDNAIKFTPSGGRIQLEVLPGDYYVQIKVSDTGIGIPANRINEIFEPFHQLDGASTRRYGGTGLGLSLVKKILEAHDSTVLVSSELGNGSQFWFSLPQVLDNQDTKP